MVTVSPYTGPIESLTARCALLVGAAPQLLRQRQPHAALPTCWPAPTPISYHRLAWPLPRRPTGSSWRHWARAQRHRSAPARIWNLMSWSILPIKS